MSITKEEFKKYKDNCIDNYRIILNSNRPEHNIDPELANASGRANKDNCKYLVFDSRVSRQINKEFENTSIEIKEELVKLVACYNKFDVDFPKQLASALGFEYSIRGSCLLIDEEGNLYAYAHYYSNLSLTSPNPFKGYGPQAFSKLRDNIIRIYGGKEYSRRSLNEAIETLRDNVYAIQMTIDNYKDKNTKNILTDYVRNNLINFL